MDQIFVKQDKCMGCRSCEIACVIQHSASKNLFAAVAEKPLPLKRLFVESSGRTKMPVLCRHCDDAPCMKACITGCIYKDDRGVIMKDDSRCIGCWTCVMVCPFGVTAIDKERRVAVKCDRCSGRNTPACVDACPTKALVLENVDAFSKETRKTVVIKETQEK